MDEHSNNSFPKKFLPIALVVIILIAAVVVYSQEKTENENDIERISQTQNSVPTVSNDTPVNTDTTSNISNTLKDGTYQAVGDYVTPGGPREIKVDITLANGIVTNTAYEGMAQDRESRRFQSEFGDNYQSKVVGKNINELNLVKVAGSSLTPIGFNNALQKIKQQAAS